MSPRAKYNNRTDSQAGQSSSQVLLERQSNKPPLFRCLWKRMAREQLPTCFSTHTGRCWGKWKRRTYPTGCKLNHVNLGKENPIRAAKLTLSVSDERCCFQSQRLSENSSYFEDTQVIQTITLNGRARQADDPCMATGASSSESFITTLSSYIICRSRSYSARWI